MDNSGASDDWFEGLTVTGDFQAATLDGYFAHVQGWLRADMNFLRKTIRRQSGKSVWVRRIGFACVAAGLLLPLPIFGTWPGWPSGIELAYLFVVLGGLVLLLDQLFSMTSSYPRLQLAELQMKQVRYRLDLEWAKRRPALAAGNEATEGPILVDLLRAAMEDGHRVMEAQKTAWTGELHQAMATLRSRLDGDRQELDRLRNQSPQGQARLTAGAPVVGPTKPVT